MKAKLKVTITCLIGMTVFLIAEVRADDCSRENCLRYGDVVAEVCVELSKSTGKNKADLAAALMINGESCTCPCFEADDQIITSE